MLGCDPFIIVTKQQEKFLSLGSNLNWGECKTNSPRGENCIQENADLLKRELEPFERVSRTRMDT